MAVRARGPEPATHLKHYRRVQRDARTTSTPMRRVRPKVEEGDSCARQIADEIDHQRGRVSVRSQNDSIDQRSHSARRLLPMFWCVQRGLAIGPPVHICARSLNAREKLLHAWPDTRAQFSDMLQLIEAQRFKRFHFTVEEGADGTWPIKSWGMAVPVGRSPRTLKSRVRRSSSSP